MKHNQSIQYLTDGWKFHQVGKPYWYSAKVPGCVHLDLLNNNLIEDPFYRDNEKKVQWIDREYWEYRLTFNVDSEIFSKKHIQLVFKGLDTYANVLLNDQQILYADNMFRVYEVEVKPIVRKKNNQMIIHFRSPILEVLPKIEKEPFKLPAANDMSIGTSPYTRKAPYHYEWDWGPRLITCGIWQLVKLEAWDNIKIIDLTCVLKKLSKKKAYINISVKLISDFSEKAVLKIFDDVGTLFKTISFYLKPGLNTVASEFNIKYPQLWWPNGYGAQSLYTFHVEISTKNETVQSSRRIGLRTLEIKRENDERGQSFTFIVNGMPLFAKGTNWIPADNFTPRVTKENYHYLLTSAARCHMNMIRVWGGGIYEADSFYDLCDELGLLVWQDFMFSCAMYPGDKAFLNSVRQEAMHQIRRLRHHPSIAVWCGNNEIGSGWYEWGWHKNLDASVWDDYIKLFHVVLPEVCRTEDPTRTYWPSSPSDDIIPPEGPQNPSFGDTHYWGVWHGKEPFENYLQQDARFVSEYGFQSFPEPTTVNEFTIDYDRDIFSPVMLCHQRSKNGNSLIKEYMEQYYKVPKSFNHFLLLSQILQAEGIKMGAEHFRRLRPRCMGSLYWQLNDCWPVASWSSIDYYGRWKALQYYARRFYTPILISPVMEHGVYHFYIVSDKTDIINAKINIQLWDIWGNQLSSWVQHIQIRPLESAVYFSLPNNELPQDITLGETCLYCNLEIENKIISENAFYFVQPKDFKLIPPQMDTEIVQDESGFVITLFSPHLIRSVILSAKHLEGHFEDNFFDLYPNQRRCIRFFTTKEIHINDFKNVFTILTMFELMEN